MLKALIIDHKDSFTYNIKAWLSVNFSVDVLTHLKIKNLNGASFTNNYDLIILSPGPLTPYDYPDTVHFLKNLSPDTAVLGICLGLQMMTIAEQGQVKTYSPPVHGKASLLKWCNSELAIGKLAQAQVARYHSLYCEPTNHFKVLANAENLPMIVQHTTKKWLGFQFHPESFLTNPEALFRQLVVLHAQKKLLEVAGVKL